MTKKESVWERAQRLSRELLAKAFCARTEAEAAHYSCLALKLDPGNAEAMFFLLDLDDDLFTKLEMCRDFALVAHEELQCATYSDGAVFSLEKQPELFLYARLRLREVELLKDLGRFHEALAVADEVRAFDGNDFLHIDRYRLALYLALDKTKQAAKLLKDMSNDDPFALLGQAVYHYKKGQLFAFKKSIQQLLLVNSLVVDFLVIGPSAMTTPNIGDDEGSFATEQTAHEVFRLYFAVLAAIPSFFDYLHRVFGVHQEEID